jgi:predicted transposase/invertase (TIGR01784 family)
MASIAEKWKEQRKKEGRKEGKWNVVKKSLKEGLPIKTIERITGFPSEEIYRFKEKLAHKS